MTEQEKARRIVDLEQAIRAVAKRLRSAAEICRDNREMWAGRELEVGADALEDALGRTA